MMQSKHVEILYNQFNFINKKEVLEDLNLFGFLKKFILWIQKQNILKKP